MCSPLTRECKLIPAAGLQFTSGRNEFAREAFDCPDEAERLE